MSTDQYFLKGKYKLSTIPHEMRMSHWVYAPVIINTDNDEIILNLEGNIWDFRSAKETRDSIILKLARYPDGNKEYEVDLKSIGSEHLIFSALVESDLRLFLNGDVKPFRHADKV